MNPRRDDRRSTSFIPRGSGMTLPPMDSGQPDAASSILSSICFSLVARRVAATPTAQIDPSMPSYAQPESAGGAAAVSRPPW